MAEAPIQTITIAGLTKAAQEASAKKEPDFNPPFPCMKDTTIEYTAKVTALSLYSKDGRNSLKIEVANGDHSAVLFRDLDPNSMTKAKADDPDKKQKQYEKNLQDIGRVARVLSIVNASDQIVVSMFDRAIGRLITFTARDSVDYQTNGYPKHYLEFTGSAEKLLTVDESIRATGLEPTFVKENQRKKRDTMTSQSYAGGAPGPQTTKAPDDDIPF